MRWGTEWPQKRDLSSLRLLGSVGEPINPEAWVWYYRFIGGERCPVVDTWWQTETGAIMITPLPGITSDQARFGDAAVPRHQGGDQERQRRDHRGRRRRAARPHASVAGDAARHLRRSRALRDAGTGAAGRRTSTSPATAPSVTRTASSGCSAAWTTCSTWPATASARWKWRARWSITRASPKPPSSGGRTRSRARRSPRS